MTPTTYEGKTFGKYRILEPLGRGGMAQVYRAYHPQLDRYVAVKVLRSDLVEEEEFLARFQREARAVAALRHPNVVHVYDFDVEDSLYYMVMELLDGNTLKAFLNDYRTRNTQLPYPQMVRILLDVLGGMGYAHQAGIIHRDIKPANILLTRNGQAVVTDFGIAQIVGATQYTVSGALMGTLNYMAPEQGLEGRADARSDIYSLGIVLYEMLIGRTPYDADTPLAILMKHVNDPLPLPRQTNPAIPEPFERVVLKALAKRPEDRYQSAEEMADALRNALTQAGMELPDKIALPLAMLATPAPATPSSVGVFSGTARQRIDDAQFAADDTDANVSQRLKGEATAQTAASGPADDAADVSKPHYAMVIERLAQTAGEALAWLKPLGGSPFQNIGKAIALLIGGNMVAVMICGFMNDWSLYSRGWTMEMFAVTIFLSVLMVYLKSIWMLIPVGIVFSQAVLLSYFSLSNLWGQWFLWLADPLLVFGLVWTTIGLARQTDYPEQARQIGRKLTRASLACMLIVFTICLGFTAS